MRGILLIRGYVVGQISVDGFAYFLPKTSFNSAVVCAAGFLRILFSSSPSM